MAYDSHNLSIKSKESWTALTLGLQFAPIPTGLLFAQVLSNLTFKIEDTYFTQVGQAHDKISWINISVAILTVIVAVSTSIRMPEVSHFSRCSFVRKWLRTKGFWANMIQVSMPIISFFALIPQWSYICNQFAFPFD